jgi:hypothetical protein
MIGMMAGIVDNYILTPRDVVSPEAMHTISGLYQQKANGMPQHHPASPPNSLARLQQHTLPVPCTESQEINKPSHEPPCPLLGV